MISSRAAAFAAAATMAAAALGCGSDDDDGSTGTSAAAGATATATTAPATTTAATDKPANVAFVVNAYTDFVQAQEAGLKKAVAPGGGSVTVFNPNFDPQKQTQQCRDVATSGKYDVIVLSTIEHATGVPCVTAAKAADIPVITIDLSVGTEPDAIEPTVDGVAGALTLSPKANALHVAELTKLACADVDPCEIIAETVTPNDSYTETALKEVEAQVPNAKIVQRFASGFDPSVVVKTMPDALTAHPEADVFLSVADSNAVAAFPAIKQAGLDGKIKVIGNGGSRLGAKAVADGTLFGTTGHWPEQEGKVAGEWAVQLVNGGTIDPNGVDVTLMDEPGIVDQDTVEQFTAEWGASS